MTPQSAKAKGRNFQKLVRDKLLKAFPSLEPDDIRSTSMGAGGEDLQLSPAARKLIGYQIECKSKSKSQIHTYYEQAKEHGTYEPLVVVKQDRKLPLAIVRLDHFIELIKKATDANN